MRPVHRRGVALSTATRPAATRSRRLRPRDFAYGHLADRLRIVGQGDPADRGHRPTDPGCRRSDAHLGPGPQPAAGKRTHGIAEKLRMRSAQGKDEAHAAVKRITGELADLAERAANDAERLLSNARRALRRAQAKAEALAARPVVMPEADKIPSEGKGDLGQLRLPRAANPGLGSVRPRWLPPRSRGHRQELCWWSMGCLFLHRDELVGTWDLSVFLQVPFPVSVARLAARDGTPADPEDHSLVRYVAGQRLYFTACQPWHRAALVIDATDLDAPSLC